MTAPPAESLSGRVALVTGGTRGIGAAICNDLARRGATVAAGFSSNRERADAFLRALPRSAGAASVHQGNVGDPEDCARVVSEVIDEHGRLDILVNNAGVTLDRPVSAMTVDEWHTVLRVNLSGAFYMSKPALVHMLERGSGRIINISSITGEIGNVGQANYAASKAGLLGLTKTLAREAALSVSKSGKDDRIGLTVNAVTPGLIETDMTAAVPAKALERLRASAASVDPTKWPASSASWRPTPRDTSPGRRGPSTAASTCEVVAPARIPGRDLVLRPCRLGERPHSSPTTEETP